MKSVEHYFKTEKGQKGPREVVSSMGEKDKYFFESFSADLSSFDGMFTNFVNNKYFDGWDYKDCHYYMEGDKRHAYCLFKKT